MKSKNLFSSVVFAGLLLPATLATAQSPGSVDLNFGTTNTLNGAALSFAVQPDGRVLLAGAFNFGQGQSIPAIVRLDQNGLLDPTWKLTSAEQVARVILQPDGKVLAMGSFQLIQNAFKPHLARLRSDGLLDPSFKLPPYNGIFQYVRSAVVRPDGKIIIVGQFNGYFGHATTNVALLHPDGTVDTAFSSRINGANSSIVESVSLTADGNSVLIAGANLYFGEVIPANLWTQVARLDVNTGAVDPGFKFNNSGISVAGSGALVEALPDGRVLLGGVQAGVGSPYNGLIRLNANGALDTTFQAGPTASHITPAAPFTSFKRLANGRILAGGTFHSVQGQPFTNVVQLLPDGAVDPAFSIGDGFNNSVLAVAGGPGGALYVGGFFTTAGSEKRPHIARLHGLGTAPVFATQPASATVFEGEPVVFTAVALGDPKPLVEWFRGATSLGLGSSFTNPAVTLADAGQYHAVAGNGSGSIPSDFAQLTVQTSAPVIVAHPRDREVRYGFAQNITFDVTATGSQPFTYQWRSNDVDIAGATSRVLSLTLPLGYPARPALAAQFSVRVTNARGSTVSNPAWYRETTIGGTDNCFFTVEGVTVFDWCIPPTGANFPSYYNARAIAVQSTDEILIAGGAFGVNQQDYLTRVTRHQELSSGLTGNANEPNGPVNDLAVAPDDSFYAAGEFSRIGDLARQGIAKFNAAFEFQPGFAPVWLPTNAILRAVALQPDGKVLIGGTFTNVGGLPRLAVARLLPGGAVDPTFDPSIRDIYFGFVQDLAVQADGKVLVSGRGRFHSGPNQTGDQAPHLVRLHADGSWDYSFDTLGGASPTPSIQEVRQIVVLQDQRIMLAGTFNRFGGASFTNVALLLPNGTADPSFTHRPVGNVNAIRQAPDGTIYIGGDFTMFSGRAMTDLVRLLPDGSLDEGFLTGGYRIKALALMSGGDLLAVSSTYLGSRANYQDCPERMFNVISQQQPPVGSTSGTLTYCPTPRPQVSDGGLHRFLTTGLGPRGPIIQLQPVGRLALTTNVNHLLEVAATDWLGGTSTLRYQWRKNGANIVSATNSFLRLDPINFGAVGTYSVVINSGEGATTSADAVVGYLPSTTAGGLISKLLNGGLKWQFNPAPGFSFDATNIADIKLQVSANLTNWTTVAGGISIQNGNIVIEDPLPIAPKRFFRLITGPEGWSPWATADPSSIIETTGLPTAVMTAVQSHITHFLGDPGSRGPEETRWENILIAPEARYVYDPMHNSGNDPAYVEFRLIGNGLGGSLVEAGYILASLTDGDFPIIEFATRGSPKSDRILREAANGVVRKFMRFSPVYIAGENEAGAKVAELGTLPVRITGGLPASSTAVTTRFNTETGQTTLGPLNEVNFVQFNSYAEMKADYGTNALRQLARNRRLSQAFSLAKQRSDLRNPTINVQTGQTVAALGGATYAAAQLLDDGEAPVATATVQPGGGIHLTGLVAGSQLLRTQRMTGEVEHHTVLVVATGGTPALNGPCPESDSDAWYAGAGNGDGAQKFYHQLKRSAWCPAVGCGPTALAMLFGWWDHQGVPSAFYRLKWGEGQVVAFQFDRPSLATANAPPASVDAADEEVMRPVYNDLHELADVICEVVSGAGATTGGDMWEAFLQYLSRVSKPQFSPMDEFGQELVGVDAQADWVLPGIGLTDWEGGGTLVANGIKAGRPGIVGLGSTLFDAHYALAYGYKRVDFYEGCGSNKELVDRRRYFKCNMGWGETHGSEWHNAEDVWFGLTARLWQKKQPTPATQLINPLVVELGQFLSTDLNKPAAAIDAVGNLVNLFTAPQHKTSPSYFDRALSGNQANSFVDQYHAPFAAGQFKSAPAVANSASGQKLHVFGRGTDKRYWRAYSANGGTTWPVAWQMTSPPKLFTSAPAAASSSDGMIVHLAGIDTDGRLSHNRSLDGGVTWGEWSELILVDAVAPAVATSADGQDVYLSYQVNNHIQVWTSRGGGLPWYENQKRVVGSLSDVFTSSPSITTSLGGDIVHLVARGADNRFWRNISLDAGATWNNWVPIGQGVFSSAPAVVVSGDGLRVHVFGRGITPTVPPGQFGDPAEPRIWRAYSADGGATWPVAWLKVTPLGQ